ncbi:MAG: prepilin-type N-terminal cleavage/methylation domain-containing protein [bacterium]
MKQGFTLIELLIVVAIIAILAAIAIPNFLAAQTRSKVAKVKSEMATLATGIEAYHVDETWYPIYGRIAADDSFQYPAIQNNINDKMQCISVAITTPIAYITSIPQDPFANLISSGHPEIRQYEYINLIQHIANMGGSPPAWAGQLIHPRWGEWRMVGAGPDGDRGKDIKYNFIYDPTNGTISNGDVVRCQLRSDSVPCPGQEPGT